MNLKLLLLLIGKLLHSSIYSLVLIDTKKFNKNLIYLNI